MKGNNGKGNNPTRDEWETPNKLWYKLHEQYDFEFDCCATEENSKCGWYSFDFESVEIKDDTMCWMNPPFSKADKMFRHFFKMVSRGVAIYRIDNIETDLWNKILYSADWIHIIKGRVNYEGHEGKGARFGSALIGIGVPKPKEIEGVTLRSF